MKMDTHTKCLTTILCPTGCMGEPVLLMEIRRAMTRMGTAGVRLEAVAVRPDPRRMSAPVIYWLFALPTDGFWDRVPPDSYSPCSSSSSPTCKNFQKSCLRTAIGLIATKLSLEEDRLSLPALK